MSFAAAFHTTSDEAFDTEDLFESEPTTRNDEEAVIAKDEDTFDFSSIHDQAHLSADMTLPETDETNDEDICILESQVERHILVISRWIHTAHAMAKSESYWWQGFAGPANTLRDKLMPKSSLLQSASERSQSTFENTTGKKKTQKSPVSDKFFPPLVEVPPKVEESFRELDACLLKAKRMSTESDKDGSERVHSIVNRVAQLPSFIKTILLVHKKETRKVLLSTKIVRRVMFCPMSVMPEDMVKKVIAVLSERSDGKLFSDNSSLVNENPSEILVSAVSTITETFSLNTPASTQKKSWLVHMLETGYGPIKKIAVNYLEQLSDLTVIDYIINEGKNPTPVDVDLFLQSKKEIFSEVESLRHLVTAMISLDDAEKERAAVTPIIQRVLDKAVLRPFGTTLFFSDLVFHIFILFGWRSVTFRLVDVNTSGNKDSDDPHHLERFVQSMFFISSIYFTWRLVGEIFSTLITSWRVFQVNFLTFWTLVDVTAIAMAFIAFGIIESDGVIVYSDNMFRFFALLNGFLWLKLLSFLKVMNPILATFMLAIVQILKDTVFLLVILGMVTLGFGDMFYIIISTDSTICPADPDQDDDGNPYCDRGMSYLDAYVQIIGNFDYGSFLDHPSTIVLFIIMTLFGAIIFLNILIAVVSDSYSESTAKSARLFGRARILTVAKMNALEHLMEPEWCNRGDGKLIRIFKVLFKLFSFVSVVLGAYWLVKFTTNIDNSSGSTATAVLASVFLGVFLIGSLILFSLLITGWGERRILLKLKVINDNVLITWIYWKPMVFITNLILGLTSDQSNENNDEDADEWSGRMQHIDSTINQTVETSEAHLVEKITLLETKVKESEQNRAEEAEALKVRFASQDNENLQQRLLLEKILERMERNPRRSSFVN